MRWPVLQSVARQLAAQMENPNELPFVLSPYFYLLRSGIQAYKEAAQPGPITTAVKVFVRLKDWPAALQANNRMDWIMGLMNLSWMGHVLAAEGHFRAAIDVAHTLRERAGHGDLKDLCIHLDKYLGNELIAMRDPKKFLTLLFSMAPKISNDFNDHDFFAGFVEPDIAGALAIDARLIPDHFKENFYTACAKSCAEQGKLEQALSIVQSEISNPDNVILQEIGEILIAQGKFKEVIQRIIPLIQDDWTIGCLYKDICKALVAQGKIEEGLRLWKEERREEILGHVFEALFKMGRLQEAFALVNQLFPHAQADAAWKIILSLVENKKLAEAHGYIAQLADLALRNEIDQRISWHYLENNGDQL